MVSVAAGLVRMGAPVFGLILAACDRGSATEPAAQPSGSAFAIGSTVAAVSSSAPPVVESALPAASASALPESCMSAEDSMDRAKPHKAAAAPFSECAAGVFGHCGAEQHYCSLSLNEAVTRRARKIKPGVCCYHGP